MAKKTKKKVKKKVKQGLHIPDLNLPKILPMFEHQDDFGEWSQLMIHQHANNVALRFGAPIYLVGSALTSKEPADLDLIMVVSDKKYDLIIGTRSETNDAYMANSLDRSWSRWFKFIHKQGQYFERGLRSVIKVDVDFKIQRASDFKIYKDHEVLRLDFFGKLAEELLEIEDGKKLP